MLDFCKSCLRGVPEVRIPQPGKELRKLLEMCGLNALGGGNQSLGNRLLQNKVSGLKFPDVRSF